MEGNTIRNFTITKRVLSKENSFKYMIKGTNLTSLYTLLDILSPPLVAPIFFPFNLKVIMEGHIMAYYLSTSRDILLEYYQLNDAI